MFGMIPKFMDPDALLLLFAKHYTPESAAEFAEYVRREHPEHIDLFRTAAIQFASALEQSTVTTPV